jgi:ABC-type Fe3+/spermidine/putrescine transport system ATPase subunit
VSPARTSTAGIEIADLVVRYGEAPAVDGVSFTVAQGEHVTLLGPSGCGKTTTLRAIAGLEQPSGGSIRINGETVYSAAARRNVPAEKRGASMVFQSYAVWPHMSVADNVAYGLRVRKLPRAEIAEQVARALDLVQMRGFAERSAALLSGGQQQRVALARAIAFSPDLLLFDEPLSNLDAKLRAEMRVELRALQHRLGVTSLYVTHDQEEALAISDRVIVMNVGGIEQIGTPEDIYNRPKTRFVADFVGSANLIAGRVGDGASAPGPVDFNAAGGIKLRAWAPHAPRGGETHVAVRTAYIDMAPGIANGAVNRAPGTIRQRLFHGDFIQYIVDWPAGALTVRRPPTEMFDEGAAVTLSFAPEHCILLEA